jgi:hypothetical protein
MCTLKLVPDNGWDISNNYKCIIKILERDLQLQSALRDIHKNRKILLDSVSMYVERFGNPTTSNLSNLWLFNPFYSMSLWFMISKFNMLVH